MHLGYGRAASNILILSHLILAILSLLGSLLMCVCVEGGPNKLLRTGLGKSFHGGIRARGGGLFKVSSAGD